MSGEERTDGPDVTREVRVDVGIELDVRVIGEFASQRELDVWLADESNREVIVTTLAARMERTGDGMDRLGWLDDDRQVILGEPTSHVFVYSVHSVRPIFGGALMSTEEKIAALVEEGGYTEEEAVAMLTDAGEL